MATKTLSNEFIQKMMTDEAWKELSSDFNWSEALLEKYQDKVDWSEISENRNIRWTIPMIQKFKNRINWEKFSLYIEEEVVTENIIETFKDKWNWHKLSENSNVVLTYDLLDRFSDLWDWGEIIDRYSDQPFEGRGIEFYERYKEHIPTARLQVSQLWYDIVRQQKRQLIAEITA